MGVRILEVINEKTLRDAHQEYEAKEGRARYYDYAVEIANAYPLQASIIILAVWNIARFRVLRNEEEKSEYRTMLERLKKVIDKDKSTLERLGKDFKTFDFRGNETPIKEIYRDLSGIKGVEHTGASKVMHLLNRHLFLMWDSDMRQKYGYKRYKPNADSYIKYHEMMKNQVKNIEWNRGDITLPKAIDEFNFVNITLPRFRKQKLERVQKRKKG
jgi:hypothetical protein